MLSIFVRNLVSELPTLQLLLVPKEVECATHGATDCVCPARCGSSEDLEVHRSG